MGTSQGDAWLPELRALRLVPHLRALLGGTAAAVLPAVRPPCGARAQPDGGFAGAGAVAARGGGPDARDPAAGCAALAGSAVGAAFLVSADDREALGAIQSARRS